METKYDPLDNKLLNSYRANRDFTPPSGGWDRIAAELPPPKKERKFWWWVFFSGFSLLAGFILISGQSDFSPPQSTSFPLPAVAEAPSETEEVSVPSVHQNIKRHADKEEEKAVPSASHSATLPISTVAATEPTTSITTAATSSDIERQVGNANTTEQKVSSAVRRRTQPTAMLPASFLSPIALLPSTLSTPPVQLVEQEAIAKPAFKPSHTVSIHGSAFNTLTSVIVPHFAEGGAQGQDPYISLTDVQLFHAGDVDGSATLSGQRFGISIERELFRRLHLGVGLDYLIYEFSNFNALAELQTVAPVYTLQSYRTFKRLFFETSLRYELLRVGKWSLDVAGGLGYQVYQEALDHQTLIDPNTNVKSELPTKELEVEKKQFRMRTSAFLAYRFAPTWQIHVEAGYQFNIFENEARHIGLGLRKNF